MAYLRPYRVAETTTSTGTGSITLAGAVTGFAAFSSALANGDTATIVIEAIDAAGRPTGAVEICDTTFAAPDTLSRGTLRYSNTGSRINFAAGDKRVFAISPRDALDLASADVTGVLPVARGGTGTGTSTGTGNVVLSTSPTLVTPNLGTPSAATLTNATGLPIVAGTTGTLTVARGGTGATTLTGVLKGNGTSAFTAGTVALGSEVSGTLPVANGGTGVTTSTGTGSVVLSATPTFTGQPFFDASVRSNVVALGSNVVDCNSGNFFTRTVSGAGSWTISNVPSSRAYSFLLELTNGGTGTQTWFPNTRWPGGTAPTLTTSGVDVLGFITDDGGANWRGVALMLDSK